MEVWHGTYCVSCSPGWNYRPGQADMLLWCQTGQKSGTNKRLNISVVKWNEGICNENWMFHIWYQAADVISTCLSYDRNVVAVLWQAVCDPNFSVASVCWLCCRRGGPWPLSGCWWLRVATLIFIEWIQSFLLLVASSHVSQTWQKRLRIQSYWHSREMFVISAVGNKT